MGIRKIRPRGPGRDNCAQKGTQSRQFDELSEEEIIFMQNFPCYGSDECELAEVGCEHVMFGGQICNVPYDLYDLPNLKEILSLETWNTCLTEEDRFSLAAYLPDMDQETFCLTMKELLNGDSLFFENPTGKFFNCLRGGYYSPHVTQMREALTFLQRQGYSYCLKSYHEDLVKKFAEMNKLWSNCLPSTSIDERIQIWNKRMNQKPTALVDLNAVPIEEDVSNFLSSKRTNDMDGVVCAHNSVASFNGTAVSASNRAKGLLKRKPIETGSWKNQILQPVTMEPWEQRKQLPKGVLKIKPKAEILGEESVRVMRTPPQQFISLPGKLDFSENYPYVNQIDRDGNTYRDRSAKSSQSFQKKVKIMRLDGTAEISRELLHSKLNQKSSTYSNEAGRTEESPREKNFLQNFADLGCLPYNKGSEDSNQFTCSNVGANEHSILTDFSSRAEPKHRDHGSDGFPLSPVDSEGPMFPITYKRKKPYRKLNSLDPIKKPSMAAVVESSIVPTSTSNTKAKTIRIKFKGLLN